MYLNSLIFVKKLKIKSKKTRSWILPPLRSFEKPLFYKMLVLLSTTKREIFGKNNSEVKN
jgi:hypothetical protein